MTDEENIVDEEALEENQQPLWLRIVVVPLWFSLIALHFMVCTALTVFVHPERKRYKYYEYYAPWGWGERKDMPPEWQPRIANNEGETDEG